MKKLAEKMSFPMLLMAVVALTRIGSLIPRVIGLFRSVLAIRTFPMTLCSFVTFLAPFAFAVILILEKTGKLSSGKKAVGIAAIAAGAGTAVTVLNQARTILANPGFFNDIYTLMVQSPLYSMGVNVILCIMMLIVGINLVKGKEMPSKIRLLFAIGVFLIAYVGIIAAFKNPGKLMDSFYSVLYMTGLFYLPRLYDEKWVHTTAITGKKIKVLLAVLIAMAILYGIAMGSVSKPSGSRGSTNTCGSCGRSWQAGDSGKNYMNIARTGLCNNCENNYHTLKPFLGK